MGDHPAVRGAAHTKYVGEQYVRQASVLRNAGKQSLRRPSRPPSMSPAFNMDAHPRWNTNCFQLRYENVTHHLRFNHFSSCVTFSGSDVQEFVARILTILESGFVASFPSVIELNFVNEFMASIPSSFGLINLQ